MAIAFDASSTGFQASGTTLTFSHTCGAGANRALVVGVEGEGADLVSGVTYNGVAMALVNKELRPSGRYVYFYFLAAPAAGANNVIVSGLATMQFRAVAASYTGVSQTGQPEANNTGTGNGVSSLSTSVTTVTDNSWVIGVCESNQIVSAGSGTTLRQLSAVAVLGVFDAGPVTPVGAKAINVNISPAANTAMVVASIAPAVADTTPPTLTSPSGTGGTVTCSGSVSTNEGNGTLYAVVTASATAPSAAQVKAGQDHTGAAALRVVSQAVSGTGTQTIASGSCTAGARYLHVMHEDTAANQSTVVSSGSFTVAAGGDTTPPVLSSPVGTATGSTTATVGATTDEGNGTLYAVVTTSATQPSVAQIKAGQNNVGTAAAWAGSVAVSSTGAKTLSATGLTGSTTYYAHLVHSDAAGNDSNRVVSGSFTTSAPATATLTSSPLIYNTGALHLSAPFEAYVSNPTTGALVVKKTGLTSHTSTGVVTFNDVALAAATSYRVVWRRTDTGAEGLETLTAT